MLDKTSGKNGADILNVNHQVFKSCKTLTKYLKYYNFSLHTLPPSSHQTLHEFVSTPCCVFVNPLNFWRFKNNQNTFTKIDHTPDQDTLVLQPLPQRAVALIGDGKDVRGDFTEVVLTVLLHSGSVIQARERLVRVDCCQDGTDVRLWIKEDEVNYQ